VAEAPIQMGALRNPLLRGAARVLERFVYRRATRLIALSPGIRDGMVAAGAPPERVALVPNASDLDLFRPEPPPERFRIGYFGTMGEANDLGAAVEAARLLPDVEFLLVGVRSWSGARPRTSSSPERPAARRRWPSWWPARAPA
jgi:glycosyltransferase involved in cell wall biosynthesis